jgi:hypothetical protein
LLEDGSSPRLWEECFGIPPEAATLSNVVRLDCDSTTRGEQAGLKRSGRSSFIPVIVILSAFLPFEWGLRRLTN